MCFLEEGPWQEVFQSVVLDSSPFADRGELAISLWMSVCHVPRLFAETEDAIYNPVEVGSAAIQKLSHRLYQLRKRCMNWLKNYKLLLEDYCEDSLAQAGFNKRYETLGVGLGITIVLNRLILALNMNTAGKLEDDSQSLAHEVMQLEKRAYAANPRAGIFMAFKTIVARATIDTREEWQKCEYIGDKRVGTPHRTVSIKTWERWCSLKGRKINKIAQFLRRDV